MPASARLRVAEPRPRVGWASDQDFWQRAAAGTLEAVLDCLPDVPFWAKDQRGRFVACNRAFVDLVGAASAADVLGRVDADFFPAHLCEGYARDDAAVFSTGRPLCDRIEVVRNARGVLDWRSTTKLPVFGRAPRGASSQVIAVAGLTRELGRTDVAAAHFTGLAPALTTMMRSHAEALSMERLARAVSLSVSQFERRFRMRFGVTPLRYLNRIRIESARALLVGTDLPIVDVALRAGFCDQAHLSRHFVRELGIPPARYRRRFSMPRAS